MLMIGSRTRAVIERVFRTVPEAECKMILHDNPVRLYGFTI